MIEGLQVQRDASPETMRLLCSVAEQLKVPLTVIARQAELMSMDRRVGVVSYQGDVGKVMASISTQTDMALRLVDSYLLGLQLLDKQGALALEPVSVAATLTDTAHELHGLARQYGVALEVQVAGKYAPVMANARGLHAALLSLGYGLIEARAASAANDAVRRLSLAVHRTPYGIVAGLYGEFGALAPADWRRALQWYGRAPQAIPSLAAGSSAGLFIADALFSAMATAIRVGRFNKQTGLAATFQPSRQLQLV